MLRVSRILILALALLAVCPSAHAAQKAVVVQAKADSSTSITIKVTINEKKFTRNTVLTIERSSAGGPFESIAQFSKARRSQSYSDRSLTAGQYKYRARVELASGKRSSWFRSNAVALSDGTTPATPAPSNPTATPVPRATSTPTSANFDSNGNVTPAGKVVFGIPSNLSGNISAGASIWSSTCAACHSTPKYSRTFPVIKYAVGRAPMNLTTITDAQFANLTAYLNQYRQ